MAMLVSRSANTADLSTLIFPFSSAERRNNGTVLSEMTSVGSKLRIFVIRKSPNRLVLLIRNNARFQKPILANRNPLRILRNGEDRESHLERRDCVNEEVELIKTGVSRVLS
jgi:hypothetical protein